MIKTTIKISAKKAATSRTNKVWNIALPVDFVHHTLKFIPRLRLEVESGDLIIHLDGETGALVNRPTVNHSFYYGSVSLKHLKGLRIPFDSAQPVAVKADYKLKTRTLHIKNSDLPAIMQLAIRQFTDLVQEVESHQPDHSPEEFHALVQEHKGGETIGDQEALEAAFKSPRNTNKVVWTDSRVRDLKESLAAMLVARPDISVSLGLDGQVRVTKTVQEEI